jgi:hypothetical protein
MSHIASKKYDRENTYIDGTEVERKIYIGCFSYPVKTDYSHISTLYYMKKTQIQVKIEKNFSINF